MAKSKWYYGVKGVTMIWHGEWADWEVEYNGYRVNGPSLDESLWHLYKDICKEDGIEPTDEGYDKWIVENGDYMIGDLMDLWYATYDSDDMLGIEEDEDLLYLPSHLSDFDLAGYWNSTKVQTYKDVKECDYDVVLMYNETSDNEGYLADVWTKKHNNGSFVWENKVMKQTMTEKEADEKIADLHKKYDEYYNDDDE